MDIKKYDFLDQLRWIAILWIIFCHLPLLNTNLINESFLYYIFPLWYLWVPLFFIISAYTLSLSSKKRFILDKKPIKSFYIRRFFRIYPLFLLITLLVFWFFFYHNYVWNPLYIQYFWERFFDIEFKNLLYHLSFLYWFDKNYYYSMLIWEWSLFNEIIFYLIFPFIFLIIIKKWFNFAFKMTLFFLIINLISSFYWFYINKDLFIQDFIYKSPLFHLFTFMLWIFIFTIKDFKIKINHSYLILINILLYLILIYLKLKWYEIIVLLLIINIWFSFKLFIDNIYYINNKLVWNTLKYLWERCYSIYLTNIILYYIIWKFIYNNISLTYDLFYIILSISLIILLSHFLYMYEIFFINLWKKTIKKYNLWD